MRKIIHQYNVSKGRSLLVKGPASVNLRIGRARIFLAEIPLHKCFIIPEGRRVPLEITADSLLEVSVGMSGSITEKEGFPIPHDWINLLSVLDRILQDDLKILIVGGVDSGKNSLTTYLTNYLLQRVPSVFILDLDIGQSEIGYPTTIALGEASTALKGLYEVIPKSLFFIGAITPSVAIDKTFHGVRKLINSIRCLDRPLIINTDGWVNGENAINYKRQLIEIANPDTTILISNIDQTIPLGEKIDHLTQLQIVRIPPMIYKRSREERRHLRELAYFQAFQKGSVKIFPLQIINWGKMDKKDLPKTNINLLTGLLNRERFLLNLGILKNFDLQKKWVHIYTRSSLLVEEIQVSPLRVQERGRELEPFLF